MRLFDLHCDTASEIMKSSQGILKNDLSISIDKGKQFEKWVQVYAVWIPDSLRGKDAFDYYNQVYNYLKNELEKNSDVITLLKSGDNITDCNTKNVAILAIEGGAALAGDIQNLQIMHDHGVKLITLTWNAENEIGYGVEQNKGLKPFGKQVVSKMEELDMIVDVSHLSEAGFYDVASISTKPFVASHSNAYSICSHMRNLKDEQFKEIVKRKGLVGINYYWKFVSNSSVMSGNINELIGHIDHFMSLGGEDVVCLGSDFDGCDPVYGLSDVTCVNDLYNELLKKNYNQTLVDKIFYNNANCFFNIHKKAKN